MNRETKKRNERSMSSSIMFFFHKSRNDRHLIQWLLRNRRWDHASATLIGAVRCDPIAFRVIVIIFMDRLKWYRRIEREH